jgi:hypothetical protein
MRDDPTSLHSTVTADSEGISRRLVAPVSNDGYLVEAFCSEVKRSLLPKSADGGLEVIFVNDGPANGFTIARTSRVRSNNRAPQHS